MKASHSAAAVFQCHSWSPAHATPIYPTAAESKRDFKINSIPSCNTAGGPTGGAPARANVILERASDTVTVNVTSSLKGKACSFVFTERKGSLPLRIHRIFTMATAWGTTRAGCWGFTMTSRQRRRGCSQHWNTFQKPRWLTIHNPRSEELCSRSCRRATGTKYISP